MAMEGRQMGTLTIHPYHLQEKSEINKLGYPIIGDLDRIFTVPVGRITPFLR